MFDNTITAVESVATKYEELKTAIDERIISLDVRVARMASLAIIGLSIISVPVAAAPLDDVGNAMCGSGLGQLFGLVLAGIAVYLLAKAVVRAMMAFDKMGSDHDKTQFEGKQKLVGSGKTAAGAFVPVLAAGIFEVVGINTVSCFNLDLGILYMGVTSLPF